MEVINLKNIIREGLKQIVEFSTGGARGGQDQSMFERHTRQKLLVLTINK